MVIIGRLAFRSSPLNFQGYRGMLLFQGATINAPVNLQIPIILVVITLINKNMVKLTLHWEFFKSTLVLNLSVSVILTFIVFMALKNFYDVPPPLHIVYIRCFMIGGPLLCLFYKEMTRKNEYYFYFNRGISKLSLYIVTLSTYILTGSLLIIILHYAKLT